MAVTIKRFRNSCTDREMFAFKQNIMYRERDGKALTLSLFLPWGALPKTKLHGDGTKETIYPAALPLLPLLVFVQGSGFTKPDYDKQIPQMAEIARGGYVVALVDHANTMEGHALPAYLEDVKCAIRFLRHNAGKYGIDRNRVAIMGTSSGGNTALMAAFTPDDPAFRTPEYPEESDSVQAVIDCWGPIELTESTGTSDDIPLLMGIWRKAAGSAEEDERRRRISSPVNYVDRDFPPIPFMILHGDSDTLVSLDHSLTMIDLLDRKGMDVEGYIVEGGNHGAKTWSNEVLATVKSFLLRKL